MRWTNASGSGIGRFGSQETAVRFTANRPPSRELPVARLGIIHTNLKGIT